MKKLKLSIDGLKNQLEVMSAKELNSIAGGAYGDWDSADGFINNINGMVSYGMFNYGGTQDFYAEYDVSSFGGDFDPFGSNPNFSSGSINLGIGSTPANGWNYGSNVSYSFGSYQVGGTAPGLKPTLYFKKTNGMEGSVQLDGNKVKVTIKIKIPGSGSH